MFDNYYKKIIDYTEIFLRYFTAFILFLFGFSKLFPLQFISNNPLIEIPIKSLEGTDLVWSFFGYSYYYTFFPGFMQILGSIMLLYRSTKLIGSLILIPILTNIFLLNIFYGPPIFFLSGFLLFSCSFILIRDKRIVIDFIKENNLFELSIQSETTLKLFVKSLIRIFIIGIPFYLNYMSYKDKDVNKISDFNGEWIIDKYNFKANFFCPDYSWKRIIWNDKELTLYTNYKKFSGKYLLTTKNNILITFSDKDILDISGTYKFSSDHKKMFMDLYSKEGKVQMSLKQGKALRPY